MTDPTSGPVVQFSVLQISMFGPISVRVDGKALGPRDFGGVKPKQIFEILLLNRGHSIPKDRLADILWGEALPNNVYATLETYMSVLRRRIEPGTKRGSRSVIVTEPGAYRVDPERVEVDLDLFDDFVRQSHRCEGGQRRGYLNAALTLVAGDILEDEPYSQWAENVRDEHRQAHVQLLMEASELALLGDDFRSALELAQQGMALDPLHEHAYQLTMMAYYALGRQKDALNAFTRCRDSLVDELGVDPLRETETLHEAIRRHDKLSNLLPAVLRDAAGLLGPARVPVMAS